MASDFSVGILQQQVEGLSQALKESINISKIQQSQIFDLQVEVYAHQIFFYQVVYPEMQKVAESTSTLREARLRKTLTLLENTPVFQMGTAKDYRRVVTEKIKLLAGLDLDAGLAPFSVINGGKSGLGTQQG